MQTAEHWITKLDLLPHPEGGYYKETYRSSEMSDSLPERFSGPRNFSTAIYFLLRSQDRSMFHRIKSDELWHFYAGSSLSIYVLADKRLKVFKLGHNVDKGEALQVTIPANCWFGALVNDPDSFTLAGCTVSPGFDFEDFEFASRNELLGEFPGNEKIIDALTLEPEKEK